MIETLENRIVFENRFITVWDNLVRFPDGHEGTYLRTRWKAPHGVVIVPLIGQDVLLLRNYRYQEDALTLELPQGFGTEGSTPLEDAARELLEETGLVADRLEHVLSLGRDYVTHLFVARLPESARPTHCGQEATEAIAGHEFWPVETITLERLAEAGICDAMTIAGLLAVRDLT